MRLLLDTCTFLWVTSDPGKLGQGARSAIDTDSNELFLSHVSAWEIYNKSTSGKLTLPDEPHAWLTEQLAAWGVVDWPIDLASLGRMTRLPLHHRDPFDRLLVATALVHGFVILSPDAALPPYGAPIVW